MGIFVEDEGKMADDSLYLVRTNYYIGNFQAAINEAQSNMDEDGSGEEAKNVFVYRSYIGLGNYELVQDEIADGSPDSLLAVRLFARYAQHPEKVQTILQELANLSDEQAIVMTCLIYYSESQVDEGLKAGANIKSQEGQLLMIYGLLALNCHDKANEIVKRMQQEDEDNILTILASAWCSVISSTNLKDAYYQYQDTIDKFGPTPLLLNGMAIYNMKADQFELAKSALQDALEKSSNDADTLANMIAVSSFSGKSLDQIDSLRTRKSRQLAGSSPNHKWLVNLRQFEERFDRSAAQFAK